MESMTIATRTEALEAARGFARLIAESIQFQEYERADAERRMDAGARNLLTQYQEAQQTLRMLQSWSDGSSDHGAQFKELEGRVLQNPKLRRYFDSQERLVSLIQRLNRGLGEELGFDFARLAKPASGCC